MRFALGSISISFGKAAVAFNRCISSGVSVLLTETRYLVRCVIVHSLVLIILKHG